MSERDDERPTPAEIDPDAPPTEEEMTASARLRDALEDPSIVDPDAELARSLRAAYVPDALEEAELRSLVLAALDPAEVEAARALRDSLQDASIPSAGAELARALGAAWAPKEISEQEHRAIVAKALEGMPKREPARVVALGRARSVRIAAAVVTGGLALAASVFFLLQPKALQPSPGEAPLARARSTQPLFGEPFKPGEASARIDRIASARASDYRDNRFAKWGVR